MKKESKKTGAHCQTSPFAITFVFAGKKGKDLP